MNKIISATNIDARLPLQDPFVIGAYHLDLYPKGDGNLAPISTQGQNDQWKMYYGSTVPGFPVHPHRGFETITIVEKGFVDHTDGLGSKGRYGEGDVQWMTAGKGTQHAEMFPLLNENKENPLLLFQLWLNLPSNHKMVEPSYKMLWNEEIPILTYDNNNAQTKVKIISGVYDGVKAILPTPNSWAMDAKNHLRILIVDLDSLADFKLEPISESLFRSILIFDGPSVQIENELFKYKDFITLDGNSDIQIKNTSSEKVRIMVIEGEPIKEPVVAYGPFVMNSEEEIKKAYEDYRATSFGGWPHATLGPVNPAQTARFATYTDGSHSNPPQKPAA